jgi:hypothetical protein
MGLWQGLVPANGMISGTLLPHIYVNNGPLVFQQAWPEKLKQIIFFTIISR